MRHAFDNNVLYSASVSQKIIDILEQGSTKYDQYLPVFINKLLLEHTHAHLFIYYSYLLLLYEGRVE